MTRAPRVTRVLRDVQPTSRFHRSTFCADGGCVEVASLPDDEVVIRDSKDDRLDAPVLHFTPQEWDAFVAGVLDGQFTRDALQARSNAD